MTTYRLPPGANKIQMESGRTYPVSGSSRRGATVDVDHPADIRSMDKAAKVAGNMHQVGFHAPEGKPSRRCDPCNFDTWAWAKQCPRCGEPTTEVVL